MTQSEIRTFAMMYQYVPDMAERRGPYREAHRARLRQANADGFLVVGGSYDHPADAALLIVRATDMAAVYAWAGQDPYHQGGLITSVSVREFNLAFGGPVDR
ncbi:MAG TPA: YciI family protein [Chloroflexota bacterium]|nr:YciI family protein [Chloroflexota bacterium]